MNTEHITRISRITLNR